MKRIAPILTILLLVAGFAAYAARSNSVATPYTIMVSNNTDLKWKAPADNTWYCGLKLTVPAGTWRLSYRVVAYSSRLDSGTVDAITTLMWVQDGQQVVEPGWTSVSRDNKGTRKIDTMYASSYITTVGQTFALCIEQSSGGNWDSLQMLGSWSPTYIMAEKIG